MALQKNSAGFWADADGLYPVFPFHFRKHDDGLYRFKFVSHPMGPIETVESDTPYAYLPPGTFEIFIGNKWGRPMNDAEAEAVNAGSHVDAEMSDGDKQALAELEAEEASKARSTITLKGKK